MPPLYWILALVALQRIVELFYAERNTRALRDRGAVEVAPEQHPWFVVLHAGWIASMAVFISPSVVPNWYLVGIFFLLQLLRIWVIASLGPFWTTRIITLPNEPLVKRGPYRFVKHPNYAIVVAEIALLPLAFNAWQIALFFTIANALLLRWRITTEERALAPRLRRE